MILLLCRMEMEELVLRLEFVSWQDAPCTFLPGINHLKAGILVIKEGMDHALQEGISNLVVKSDAKTLIKILNLKEEPPWNLIMCLK